MESLWGWHKDQGTQGRYAAALVLPGTLLVGDCGPHLLLSEAGLRGPPPSLLLLRNAQATQRQLVGPTPRSGTPHHIPSSPRQLAYCRLVGERLGCLLPATPQGVAQPRVFLPLAGFACV